MKFLKVLSFLILVLQVVSCSQGDSADEAQKLLKKQAQLQQKDQQNLESTQEHMESTLDAMGVLEDSLSATKAEIITQKEKLQTEAARLEAEKLQIRLKQQQERMKKLSARQDSLNKILAQMNASLTKAGKDSINISQSKDSLQIKGKVVSQLDEEVRAKLLTGIKEIDTRMEELEKQKRNFQNRVTLNEKKIEVAEKKIAVLKEEKELYENQKQKLWDEGAAQSKIDAVSDMIASVDNNIEIEKQKVRTAQEDILDLQGTINGIDKQRGSLSEKIRKNYSSQEVLNEFMAEEQERLKRELGKLDTAQQRILAEQKTITLEKTALEESISGLLEEVSEVENEQLSALEQKKATLEKELSNLEQEEENLEIETGKVSNIIEDSGNSEMAQLEAEYKAMQQTLAEERAELSRQQKELAAQKEVAALEKAKRKKKFSNTIFIIIGLGVLVLIGLYFLGKSRKSTKKSKA